MKALILSGLQITKGALEILAGCSNLITLTIKFNSEYTADDTFYLDPTTSADIFSILSGTASTLHGDLGLTILTDAPNLFNLDTLKERFPFIKVLEYSDSDSDEDA
jgi:hypothetical protein